MNKNIIWSGAIALLPLLAGCYKDEGNYEYHAINELKIKGLEDNYTVDADDSLIITPELQGTLYSDTARFSYSWEIGTDEVSKSHDLRIQVDMTPGYKYSRYIITDKETNVRTYKDFGVNVSSSTAGDLILVMSKYQGRAEMSYLRLDKPANWAVNYFMNRNKGRSLGSNPQQLAVLYTKSPKNMPFVNANGRVMAIVDNVVNLIDKNTMLYDTISPVLTVDAYLQTVSYPKPSIEAYKSEFVSEGIALWRKVTYNEQHYCHFIEVSAGRLFYAAMMSPMSYWTTDYFYDVASPYKNGYFSPFGYWDDMSDTPSGRLQQAGFELGDYIVFDKVNGRFAFSDPYGDVYSIEVEDVPQFQGYTMQWGSATNRPNNTSLAVLNDGSQCRLVLLQDGKNSTSGSATKKLAGNVSGGNVMTPNSRFHMMKYNDYLFFCNGNSLYRYNIMNIGSGIAPAEKDKVFDLTQYGYDASAIITDICVSRTEKTMLVGVSRYGNDNEGMGDEPKGDLLYFDLDKGTVTLTYQAEKSHKGISGIPVDVEIKYQNHYRNGEDMSGVLKDNI